MEWHVGVPTTVWIPLLNIGTAYSNITELYKYYQAVAYVFRVILTMNTIKQLIFRRGHKIAESDY